MTRVMISCGEPSGDLYAGALTRALLGQAPGAEVFGFGGPQLEAAGGTLLGNYQGLAVTGLSEVLRTLPRTWRMYRRLVAEAERRRPDVFVAIDFADFNFRLGQALHARGIPVVYYISPQLWAWRPGRIHAMRRFVDRVLVIFPFEPPIYERAGIPVEFVGHPLVELIAAPPARAAFLDVHGLDPSAPTVGILPGSRHNEVAALLPDLLEAARRLASTMPGVQFVIARAPGLDDGLFTGARAAGVPLAVVHEQTDAVLAAADVVVTASGTATVQTALHGKPMVIVYRLSPLTYRLGRRFVKVDTFGMVNLIAGRRVVPELIQDDVTPGRVAGTLHRLLTDTALAETTRADLAQVRERLGGAGASARAAAAVLEVARTFQTRRAQPSIGGKS